MGETIRFAPSELYRVGVRLFSRGIARFTLAEFREADGLVRHGCASGKKRFCQNALRRDPNPEKLTNEVAFPSVNYVGDFLRKTWVQSVAKR